MVYDTMSEWTIVVNENAKNSIEPNFYNYMDSNTTKAVGPVDKESSVNLGSYTFVGKTFKE